MPADLADWSDPRADIDPTLGPDMLTRLAEEDGPADRLGDWPERLWALVVEAGAVRWSLPNEQGGEGCDRPTILRRYARLAEGSLTAAFILTQHDAAVRRLLPAADRPVAADWLGRIAEGRAFATVGISHLTTSRRYGPQALTANELPGGGYRLDGRMPWVTSAGRADLLVAGAALPDGRQLLIALPTDRPGLTVRPPFALAALQASCTAEVACEAVPIVEADILAGPAPEVVASAPGTAGTGGLETSALALGQARAAIAALHADAPRREDLLEPVEALADAWERARIDLLVAAEGGPDAPASAEVRGRANALVLRATQAYLTARKGSGFLLDDPAQRWARQALFFLVWSCPSPVARAAIRDLAGLCPS